MRCRPDTDFPGFATSAQTSLEHAAVVKCRGHDQAALAGNAELVRAIARRMAPLNRALFLEANPIPVKWALAQMARITLAYRLPLTELAERYHAEVREAMLLAGVELPAE